MYNILTYLRTVFTKNLKCVCFFLENLCHVRIREIQHPDLVKLLMYWYAEYHYRIPNSDNMMIEKAKEFGPMLGICEQQFKYSVGWLEK